MSRETEETWLEAQWKFDPSSRSWSWKGEPSHVDIHIGSSKDFRELARLIALQAGMDSSLDWKEPLRLMVEEAKGSKILWQLDFDLLPMQAPATEESTFRALKLSIERFTKQVWAPFKERSLGVVLYQGDLSFEGFYWDLEQIEQLAAWLGDCSDEPRRAWGEELSSWIQSETQGQGLLERFLRWSQGKLCVRQYLLTLLSQYWHYLASSLEEDCPVFIRLESKGDTLEEQIQLLAQPLWEHLHLVGKQVHPALIALKEEEGMIRSVEEQPSCTLGLVVPHPKHLGSQAASRLAELMRRFDEASVEYRLIFESQLTSHWSGLEQLIVWSEYTSDSGIRMLRGFQASMGQIYPIGKSSWSASLESQEKAPSWLHLLNPS